MKGKNILYGTALYLATIFAVYGTKAVTYQDEDTIQRKIRGKL